MVSSIVSEADAYNDPSTRRAVTQLDLALHGKNDVWGEISPDGSPWGLSTNASNSEVKFLSVVLFRHGHLRASPLKQVDTVGGHRELGRSAQGANSPISRPLPPCNLIGLAERSTLKTEIELFVDDENYLACWGKTLEDRPSSAHSTPSTPESAFLTPLRLVFQTATLFSVFTQCKTSVLSVLHSRLAAVFQARNTLEKRFHAFLGVHPFIGR